MTGINFIKKYKNSAFISVTCVGKTKMELAKKEEPTPINMSLQKKPTKILPIDSMNKGMDICQDDSDEYFKLIKELWGLLMNVKNNNLKE